MQSSSTENLVPGTRHPGWGTSPQGLPYVVAPDPVRITWRDWLCGLSTLAAVSLYCVANCLWIVLLSVLVAMILLCL